MRFQSSLKCSAVILSAVIASASAVSAIRASDATSAGAAHATAATTPAEASPTPDEALLRLQDGNERFTSDSFEHPRLSQARRCDTVIGGQHPFATILSCSDSRVPVELVFDQGIGDLFVVRVAGNVADTDEIGTIEYGVGHLHTPLVVVMGHTKCGAVTAVVEGASLPKHIAALVDNVVPATERVKREHPNLRGTALVSAAVKANVFQSIQDLVTESHELRGRVAEGKVKVVGAVYDLHSGDVKWLGPHPQQASLLAGTPLADQELVKQPTGAASDEHGSVQHSKRATPAARVAQTTDGSHTDHHDVDAHAAPRAKQPAVKQTAPKPSGDRHGSPQSRADGPTESHHAAADSSSKGAALSSQQRRGDRGMLIPASFLGGSALLSGVVFLAMKTPTRPALADVPTR